MTGAGGRVVVIGGGLAGITAALGLAEAGLPVTMLEARPWLGGATWSFGRRGLTIDNGQHVFLRCFTAYLDLLARLRVSDLAPVQDRLDLTVLSTVGPVRLRRTALPAPAHLATLLARYRPLTVSERLSVLPAAMTMWLSDLTGPDGEQASIGEWLSRHGQDDLAISQFWELFLLPFMNAPAAQTDQGTAAGFMNAALLSRRDQADIGTASVALRDLHAGPAAKRLAQLGVEVRLGAQVVGVRREAAGGFLVHIDGGATPAGEVPGQLALGDEEASEIKAAGVVLAVPAWTAGDLVPDELATDAAAWTQLKPAPVVSIHVIYDRPVTALPFATAVGSPLRWIADKTRAAGLHTGQYLAASVPAAGSLVDETPAAIRTQMLPELTQLFPAAAAAKVEDFFVTRERRATFLPAPGSRAARPGQLTRLPGLAVAGAWTDTGWPDTMEGAVRSGQLAAEVILTALTGPASARHDKELGPGRGSGEASGQAAAADTAVPAVPASAAAASVESGPLPEPAFAGPQVPAEAPRSAEPSQQAVPQQAAAAPAASAAPAKVDSPESAKAQDAAAPEPAAAPGPAEAPEPGEVPEPPESAEPLAPAVPAARAPSEAAAPAESAASPAGEDAATPVPRKAADKHAPAAGRQLTAVPGTGPGAQEKAQPGVPAQRAKKQAARQAGKAGSRIGDAGAASERNESAAGP